jgi:hypothetical protein
MPVKMTIGIVNCAIEISEGTKQGGNVRSRGGQRLIWENDDDTVQKFDLEFERIGDGDGAVGSVPDWPFVAGTAQPPDAVVDEFAGKVRGATKFAGRLADDDGIFKYNVKVTPVAPNTAPPLDPVIIVGRS